MHEVALLYVYFTVCTIESRSHYGVESCWRPVWCHHADCSHAEVWGPGGMHAKMADVGWLSLEFLVYFRSFLELCYSGRHNKSQFRWQLSSLLTLVSRWTRKMTWESPLVDHEKGRSSPGSWASHQLLFSIWQAPEECASPLHDASATPGPSTSNHIVNPTPTCHFVAAVRLLRRLPQASHNHAVSKFTTVLEDVNKSNNENTWKRLLNFPRWYFRVLGRGGRRWNLTRLVNQQLAEESNPTSLDNSVPNAHPLAVVVQASPKANLIHSIPWPLGFQQSWRREISEML